MAGDRPAHENVASEALFARPMNRALATAEPLCEAVGLTPRLRVGLKEITYGCWEE